MKKLEKLKKMSLAAVVAVTGIGLSNSSSVEATPCSKQTVCNYYPNRSCTIVYSDGGVLFCPNVDIPIMC